MNMLWAGVFGVVIGVVVAVMLIRLLLRRPEQPAPVVIVDPTRTHQAAARDAFDELGEQRTQEVHNAATAPDPEQSAADMINLRRRR